MSYVSEMTDDQLITKLISEAIDFGKLPPHAFGDTGTRLNPRKWLNELEVEARERFRVLRGGRPLVEPALPHIGKKM